jgi:RNA polymerase sigma-70 factor (ECF subfamily)
MSNETGRSPQNEISHKKDEASLNSFQAGNIKGFEDIVSRHQDRVFRLALVFTNDYEDARDASQEVFLRAFRGLHSWRFESRLSTWLFRLTLNVCREIRRRRMRETEKRKRWLQLVAPVVTKKTKPTIAETDGPLRLLVEKLPERQKEVVVLRVFQDLSVAETAAVLNIPEGTVKSNFFKALENLRSQMNTKNGDRDD